MEFLGIKGCTPYEVLKYSYGCKLSDMDNISFKKFLNMFTFEDYEGKIESFIISYTDNIFCVNDIRYPLHSLCDEKKVKDAMKCIGQYVFKNYGISDITDIIYDGTHLFCNTCVYQR